MSKNKVEIDVLIDDKGTMKKVALESKNVQKNIRGVNQTASSGGKNFGKMAAGAGGLVGAYATLAATAFAVSAAFSFMKNAADVRNMEKSQVSFAANTGVALQSLTARLRVASGGMLKFRDAAAASAMGVAKGFSGAQMEALAVGATKVSAAMGIGFEDAFDRLVRGAAKAEPELLDELGITLRLETATKNYGAAIGVAADDLNSFQRSQAVLIETQRQLDAQFGQADSLVNPFIQLSVAFDNVAKKVQDGLLPAFEKLALLIATNLPLAVLAFGGLAFSILAQIPAVQSLFKWFNKLGTGATLGFGEAKKALVEYNTKVKATEKSLLDLNVAASKKATGIAGQFKDTKSKTVKKLAAGETLGGRDKAALGRALKSAEAQYKKSGQITTGIFAGEDIKKVRHFKEAFEQMNRTSKTTWQKITSSASKGVRTMKIGLKGLKTGFTLVGRAGVVAFNAIGRAMKTAMKATVILGVISTIIEGLSQVAKAPATVVNNIIEMISSFAKGVEWLVNFWVSMVNKIITSMPDSLLDKLGIPREGIPPLTFADGVKEKLIAMAGAMLPMEEWAKDEALNKQLEVQTNAFKDLADEATLAATAVSQALSGMSGKSKGKQTLMTASSIDSSGIVSIANKIKAAAGGDETLLKRELDKLVTSFTNRKGGNDLKALSPSLYEALTNYNLDEANKIAVAATAYSGAMTALDEGIRTFSSSTSADDIIGMQLYIENLQSIATDADRSAIAFGGAGDALEKFGNAFPDSLLVKLQGITQESERIRLANDRIGMSRAENSSGRVPAGVAQARETMLKYKEDLLKLDTLINEQAALQIQLGQTNGETNKQLVQDSLNSKKSEIALQKIINENSRENATIIGQLQTTAVNTLETSMQAAMTGLINGTMSVKEAFASMALAILEALQQVIVKMLAVKMIEMLLGGFMMGGSISSQKASTLSATNANMGAKVGAGFTPKMPGNRYGGVVGYREGGIAGYAAGGISRGSDANSGHLEVLHGTEAVVPLPNGKSIPVDMKGSGQQNNIVVNVSVDKDGRSTTDSSGDMGGMNLGNAIAKAVQQELINQKRSGGILSPYGAT